MSTLRILLAEDNQVNQKVVVRMLQKLGYSPDVASNGEEAAALARVNEYDLIFMDLMMPLMDGYEATSVVRNAESSAQHAYIIALTANAMGSDRTRCLESGMDDFMTKPFMMETLKEKMSYVEWARQSPIKANDSAPTPGPLIEIDDQVDRSVLRSLASLMDDEDTAYIRELLNDYLTDAERLRTEIYKAIEASDADLLRRSAHTLKSTSSTFGALQLSSLCSEFEQSAIRSELAMVAERLPEFSETLKSFHETLIQLVETDAY